MEASITQRQLEIIEAAGKILTTAGVSGLTIKNLARQMQFSESAIYRHFASKEEIVVTMLNYLAQSMDERLAVISGAEASAEEKFIRLFQEQIRFFSQHPHFVVAVFSDGLMEESQLINQTILKIMGVKMKHLLPIVLAGQQDGTFSNAVTTEQLIQIVMGTFRLQMFMWRAANFQFDLLAKGESMIHALLTLIKGK